MWYLRPRVVVHTVCRDLSGVFLCKHATSVTVIMDVIEGLSVLVFDVVQCYKSGYLLYVCVGEQGSTTTQVRWKTPVENGFQTY